MFEKRLTDANPWWANPDSIDKDPAIEMVEHSRIRRAVDEKHRVAAEDRTYLLSGPRRVGKTTLLKMEIRRLVRDEGVPPANTMYFAFDTDMVPIDIVTIVNEYFAMHKVQGRRFLFFDEITSVKRWYKAVKNMLDIGRLANCTLVVTGSQATDIVGPAGHIAGRAGRPMDDTVEAVLEPMSFREYALARDAAILEEVRRLSLVLRRDRLDAVRSMFDGELPAPVRGLLPLVADLNIHLHNYLLVGGMPAIVNQFAAGNSVHDDTYGNYGLVARADMTGAGLKYDIALRMLSSVAASVGSTSSWSSLAKAAKTENYRLVEDYANALSDLFLLRTIYRYNSSEDAPHMGSLKKVYFRDPLLYNLVSAAGMGGVFARTAAMMDNPMEEGRAVEQVVAGHADRLAPALGGRIDPLDYAGRLFYWKGRNGREVDFVVRAGGRGSRLVPIEVKWQGRVRRSDMYGIFDFRKATGASGGGIVLSRDEALERAGLVVVPAALFALLV